jgi:hypothetical protein
MIYLFVFKRKMLDYYFELTEYTDNEKRKIKYMVLLVSSIDIFLLVNLGLVIKYPHVACINSMHQAILCARVAASVGNLLLLFNFRNYGYE